MVEYSTQIDSPLDVSFLNYICFLLLFDTFILTIVRMNESKRRRKQIVRMNVSKRRRKQMQYMEKQLLE